LAQLFSVQREGEAVPKKARRPRQLARTDRCPRSIEEAAVYLGVTVRTMRTLRYHPDLHPAKIAGRLMYDPDDLDAFFEACKRAS
jgi:hypothetical protein